MKKTRHWEGTTTNRHKQNGWRTDPGSRETETPGPGFCRPRLKRLASPLLTSMLLFFALTGHSLQAAADGMAMPSIEAIDQSVRATDQRALLWLRDGVWEMHIQPVFEREQAAAAWVVPFPALPQVSESNAALFRDLEVITSPVVLTYCTPPSRDGGVGADAGAGGGGDISAVDTVVAVWEEGEVGQLDYVILSAGEGDDLVAWLNENGYVLPEGAPELIGEFETHGQYFFVAQIGEDADPSKPVSPVRFALPGMDPPLYPLRLTGLAVHGSEELALTLWVAFPAPYSPDPDEQHTGFVPQSHPFARLRDVTTEQPTNADHYDQIVADYYLNHPSDQLLLQYGQHMSYSFPITNHRCQYLFYLCASREKLGFSFAPDWSPEIEEMVTEDAWLLRFEGALDATAMAEDLVLEEVAWSWENIDPLRATNVFAHDTGTCPSDDDPYDPDPNTYRDAGTSAAATDSGGCSVTNGAGQSPTGLFLFVLLALASLAARPQNR